MNEQNFSTFRFIQINKANTSLQVVKLLLNHGNFASKLNNYKTTFFLC